MIVDQRTHATPFGAGDKDVADVERAALDQHGRDRATAAVERRLDHDALGGALGIGLEIEDLGLQHDRLLQLVETLPGLGRDLDRQHIATELLDHQAVLQQIGAHPLRIGLGLVDLVDRHQDRHVGRFGVRDRLDGLRHDAVVRRNHQHDDIGDRGAARAHLGERLVAGRVDEGDLVTRRQRDAVGADVLRDAAGLVRGDVGRAQRVEQRGLAVVDMTHHGDDRRAWLHRGVDVGLALQADLDVGFRRPLRRMAELGDDQLGGVGVDHLVDRRHHAHAHQRLDDVGAALGHAAGEVLDRDGVGDDDVTNDLLRAGFLLAHALALALAPDRREAARAFVLLGRQRLGHRHLAGAAARLAALDRRRAAGHRRARTARPVRGVFLLLGGGARPRLGGGGIGGDRDLLRAGLAFDPATGRARRRGIGFGRLGRGAVGRGGVRLFDLAPMILVDAPERLLLAEALGFFLGADPRDLVGLDRALERAHARRLFLLGQLAQRDRLARRRRRGGLGLGGRRRLDRLRLGRLGPGHALALDLDRDGLRAAMREALAHARCFGRTLELELAAAGERQRLLAILFVLFFGRHAVFAS